MLGDIQSINRRLMARLSLAEFFAIVFALSLTTLSVLHWPPSGFHVPVDYGNYLQAARGDFDNYYYAYWFIPVLKFFERMPAFPGFVLWSLLNLAGVFMAARLFGGKPTVILISYQMLYTLFYGQIVGIILGGLALTWFGLASRRWHLAGIGLVIAGTKFQAGLLFSICIWLSPELTWKERMKTLLIPIAVGLVSLWLYPSWPWQLLATIQTNPPNDWGNLALWRWLGPLVLLLWLPPILLPLGQEEKLKAWVAASALAVPYFQQTDLLVLYVLPVGWLPAIGYLALLHYHYGWLAMQALAALPLTVYIAIIFPAARRWWLRRLKARNSGNSITPMTD
jgi:hypothetical protein